MKSGKFHSISPSFFGAFKALRGWPLALCCAWLLGACGGGGGDALPATPANTPPSATTPSTPPATSGNSSVSQRMVAELPANTKCPAANNTTLVYAGVECLVLKTFTATASNDSAKLVVFLHGDVSAGGPADYMDNYAPAYASAGVVAVRMLRPGYFDSNGVASTGGNGSRLDTYTANNVQAVAYGLAALRQHHKASKLVVVGHSGGASIAATILGKYPGLIDATALMACPCDVRAFAPTWVNSLSPLDWVAGVPLGSHVVSMTGTLDTQVPVVYSQPYVNALVARGIPARHISIPGATHSSNTIFTQALVQDQIRTLLQ